MPSRLGLRLDKDFSAESLPGPPSQKGNTSQKQTEPKSQKPTEAKRTWNPKNGGLSYWVEMMFLFNWVIFLLPALNFQGNHHFIFAKPGRQMLEDSKPTPKVFRWSLSLSSFLPPFLPRILESEKPTTQGQKPKSQQKPEKQKKHPLQNKS